LRQDVGKKGENQGAWWVVVAVEVAFAGASHYVACQIESNRISQIWQIFDLNQSRIWLGFERFELV
jgi:hypothetical protein